MSHRRLSLAVALLLSVLVHGLLIAGGEIGLPERLVLWGRAKAALGV